MELIKGLVSVSFRQLSYTEIIRAAKDAALDAIEWGGDIHVPSGKAEIANTVRVASEKAGLIIPEYGSYYTLGSNSPEKSDAVILSSRALMTDRIRLWAGAKSLPNMTKEEYSAAVSDAIRLCSENTDLFFCLECHNNTITEDYHDSLQFLKDVNCKNLQMFWQPNQFRDHKYNLRSLEALLPHIRSVHVFAWEGERHLPLEQHRSRWSDHLSILRSSPFESVCLMLEFMHDNSPSSLKATAETLDSLIRI